MSALDELLGGVGRSGLRRPCGTASPAPFMIPGFLFGCAMPLVGLRFPARDGTPAPCSGSVDPNHWTARGVPRSLKFHYVLHLVCSVGLVFLVLGKAHLDRNGSQFRSVTVRWETDEPLG